MPEAEKLAVIEYIKTFPGVRFMRSVDVATMWEKGV